MSDDTSPEQQFQEKPDWKGKIKGAFQKSKQDITGFLKRPKGGTQASPLSPDSGEPREDRTLAGLVRMAWKQKVQPGFSKLKRSSGGDGDDLPPPQSATGFQWDSRKLNGIAILFALALIAWTGADLAAFFVEKWIPEAPTGRSRGGFVEGIRMKPFAEYQVIVSRNLFSSLGRIPGDEVPGVQEQNNDPVKTSLPLNLIGTVILKNELRSVATIEDKGDSQVFPVRVEDEIPGKIKIISISTYKVVFRNLSNGKKEYVDMPEEGNGTQISVGSLSSRKSTPGEGGGIEQTAPNNFNIARTELDKYLSNINDVLTQARAIPHFENGQPAGYKLIQIVKGSVYEKLGFKDNDIICGVNGESITDPARAFELLNQLKTAAQLEICVKRDGRASNNSYNFR